MHRYSFFRKLKQVSGAMLSGHVSLSAAHRHIPNSAKKVKQRAGPEQWLKKLKSCTTLVAHVSYLKSFATS
jgi:hypothetical protein